MNKAGNSLETWFRYLRVLRDTRRYAKDGPKVWKADCYTSSELLTGHSELLLESVNTRRGCSSSDRNVLFRWMFKRIQFDNIRSSRAARRCVRFQTPSANVLVPADGNVFLFGERKTIIFFFFSSDRAKEWPSKPYEYIHITHNITYVRTRLVQEFRTASLVGFSSFSFVEHTSPPGPRQLATRPRRKTNGPSGCIRTV